MVHHFFKNGEPKRFRAANFRAKTFGAKRSGAKPGQPQQRGGWQRPEEAESK